MLMLCSLLDSWNPIVMSIGSTTTTFKLEDVVGSLLSEEMRRNSSEMAKEALVSLGRTIEKGKKKDKKGKSKSLGKKSKVKCWNCGKPSHFQRDCKEDKKKKGKKNFFDSDTDKSSQDDADSFVAALATHTSKDVWLIDPCASFHMTSHRDWFSKYEEFDGGKVYLGDNSHLNIIDCGRVKIRFPNGRVKGIDGILHIHGLARNLLSVSKLGDVGVQIVFSSDGCKMTRGSMVLAKGVRMGTLYKLDACTI